MTFIGRSEELARLERSFRSDGIRTYAIYGRRRVGKTTLIDKFCEDKPNIRFNLAGTVPEKILEHAAKDIARYTGDDPEGLLKTLKDFDDLIDFLETLRPVERTVVVMDELPDAVKAFEDVPASLMRYIDGTMKQQNLFLIVCGSSISAMMRELNGGDRPLFQRFPKQMMLHPLPYRDARLFHPDMSEEDRIRAYAICSGVPLYHEMISEYDSIDEGIRGLFLGKVPPLFMEAKNLLSIETVKQEPYIRVLSAMGDGANTLKLIYERSGTSKTRCSAILDDLQMLEYVEKKTPYGKRKSKMIYRFKDGFMDFFYSVLSGDESILTLDAEDAFQSLKGKIDTFYGKRFEDVCAQYVMSTESCTWCGSWWGTVPVREDGIIVKDENSRTVTEDVDVDLIAEVLRGDMKAVIMAECKFSKRHTGIRELNELMDRSKNAKKGGENLEYMIISRTGFTSELLDFAADRPDLKIRLVSMEGLRAWAESGEEALDQCDDEAADEVES